MPKSNTSFESVEFAGYTWLVLERKDGKALLLKDTVIDITTEAGFDKNLFINSRYSEHNWETNPYRQWVRENFYERLTQDAKSKILLTDVRNSGIHSWFGGNGGNDTQDYVFFLSDQETVKYFGDSGKYSQGNSQGFMSWGKLKDKYNKSRIGYTDDGKKMDWWLRTLSKVELSPPFPAPFSQFSFVNTSGHIMVFGQDVGDYHIGIRPALWVDEKNV